ncbi:MAG: LuxR C-terminal-related transcriptional regulator [Saccharospirillaceae bacterium]|nr:LuxR C-terminal-related transcriptional regulator [Saccharospirillaceae bacterium]MCD8531238.1 LuxR C-terminal-related transcriptional regulator [Saccharospirillaceae bacterium]
MKKSEDINLLSEFIQRIYAAVITPDDIISVLDDIRTLIDAPYSSFQAENIDTQHLRFAHLLGYNNQAITSYADYYVSCDPWTKLAYARNLLDQGFSDSNKLLKYNDYKNTEFYSDWGSQHNVVHAIGTGFRIDSGYLLKITFQRGKMQGAFSEDTERFLNLLRPHFAQFVRLSPLFSEQQRQNQYLTDILQQLARPVMVLDRTLRLIDINRQGQQWLAGQKHIVVKQDQLSCPDTRQHSELLRAVNWACSAKGKAGKTIHSQISLGQGSHEENIWIIPLSLLPDQEKPELAMLVARKPLASTTPLQLRFGLSARQAELCLLLLQGNSLEDCARDMNIAFSTARNTMIACFQKLKVSSQVQLIHCLLTDIHL